MSKKELMHEVEIMTTEERKSLRKIYKRYIIAISLVIALGVGLMIGIFSYAQSKQTEAKQNYYTYKEHIKYNASQNKLDYSMYEQAFDSVDEYFNMQKLKGYSAIILFVAVIAGAVSIWVLFRKKYPEFGVRKCSYLVDLEKEEAQAKKIEDKD